jgi:hypothetical protein
VGTGRFSAGVKRPETEATFSPLSSVEIKTTKYKMCLTDMSLKKLWCCGKLDEENIVMLFSERKMLGTF